jgi:hypothetical protein
MNAGDGPYKSLLGATRAQLDQAALEIAVGRSCGVCDQPCKLGAGCLPRGLVRVLHYAALSSPVHSSFWRA